MADQQNVFIRFGSKTPEQLAKQKKGKNMTFREIENRFNELDFYFCELEQRIMNYIDLTTRDIENTKRSWGEQIDVKRLDTIASEVFKIDLFEQRLKDITTDAELKSHLTKTKKKIDKLHCIVKEQSNDISELSSIAKQQSDDIEILINFITSQYNISWRDIIMGNDISKRLKNITISDEMQYSSSSTELENNDQ